MGQWDWKVQLAKMSNRGVQKSSPKNTKEILELKEQEENPT